MKLPDASEYGRCPCGGSYESRLVTINITVSSRDELVKLADAGQGYCPACGSRVYKAALLDLLEAVALELPAPGAAS